QDRETQKGPEGRSEDRAQEDEQPEQIDDGGGRDEESVRGPGVVPETPVPSRRPLVHPVADAALRERATRDPGLGRVPAGHAHADDRGAKRPDGDAHGAAPLRASSRAASARSSLPSSSRRIRSRTGSSRSRRVRPNARASRRTYSSRSYQDSAKNPVTGSATRKSATPSQRPMANAA